MRVKGETWETEIAYVTLNPLSLPCPTQAKLKGVGLELPWDSVLAMVLLGGTMFGLGMWRFRKQFA
jgi:ABC-2 type transport system permease protein